MHAATNVVYLNGELIPAEKATISVFDRGFLFGDAVYEVIPAYDGRLFRLEDHLVRLQRSLDAVQLKLTIEFEAWESILYQVLAANGGGDQAVYIQVSRGAPPVRSHPFPHTATPPTLFINCSPLPYNPAMVAQGITAITRPDDRWGKCYIKTTSMLANVLARQAAAEAGVDEAILLRGEHAVEGASSNLFAVYENTIITAPASANILGGITREVILEIAHELHIPCTERLISINELMQAEEVWLTSSTKTIAPVIAIDNQPIGTKQPGKYWQKVFAAFDAKIKTLK